VERPVEPFGKEQASLSYYKVIPQMSQRAEESLSQFFWKIQMVIVLNHWF
jgi:hypothetical protein